MTENKDILVLTQNEDITRVLARALKKDGYEVVRTLTLNDYLVESQGKKPRLIIYDIAPPYKEALEECARIKADPLTIDIPIIALFNAVWEREKREVFEQTRADDLLHKPFSIKEFRKAVYCWV